MTSELIEFDRSRRPANGRTDKPNVSEPPPAATEIHGEGLVIRHIVAPFDGSPIAECALPFVAAVARTFSARVTLLRVLEHPEGAKVPADALEWEMARAEALASLTRLQAALEREGCSAAVEIIQGRADEQIAHFASRDEVDLIVLSSHGAGSTQGFHLAGTIHKAIATTHASVLLVPAHRFVGSERASVGFRRILLPLDCSSRAECILPVATELARMYDAQLFLCHVVLEPEIPRRMPPTSEDLELAGKLVERNRVEAVHYLHELQSRLVDLSGRVEVRVVVAAHRTQALRDLAAQEQADLVVLCAHGNTADPRQRYGGVPNGFLQRTDVPVLILQDLAAILQPTLAATVVEPERPGH